MVIQDLMSLYSTLQRVTGDSGQVFFFTTFTPPNHVELTRFDKTNINQRKLKDWLLPIAFLQDLTCAFI